MPFVSVTRLRIRSWRFMPRFVLHTLRTLQQVRGSAGFLGGALLPDRRLAFWTLTVWDDAAAMKRYMTGGAHLTAMPLLLDWCDEASVAHWTQATALPPDWSEADRRMRGEGRASKVHHPAPTHTSLDYAPPRLSRSVAVQPRGCARSSLIDRP